MKSGTPKFIDIDIYCSIYRKIEYPGYLAITFLLKTYDEQSGSYNRNTAKQQYTPTSDSNVNNKKNVNIETILTGKTLFIYIRRLIRAFIDNQNITVERLISSGYMLSIENNIENGDTLLIWASCMGYGEIVEKLINSRCDVEAKNINGYTALMSASEGGYVDVVEKLINSRCVVDVRDNGGNTALMRACTYQHPEVVEKLIGAKCDVDARSNNGSTPIWIASFSGHNQTVKNFTKRNQIICACSEKLINARCNVDAICDGHTALYCACYEGNLELVVMLLDARCNIDLKDRMGNTVLYWASRNGHIDVVRVLLSARCDVSIRNNIEILSRNKEIFKLLTDAAQITIQ